MTTSYFSPIQLGDMEKVQLMNRVDTKFWFHMDHLQDLLDTIKDHYFLLEIDGSRELPYNSVYYETPANAMYINHHNGKLNRYKIRHRSYVNSKISFLEIKFKTNKGRTIKKRIVSNYGSTEFSQKECDFINAFTGYDASELRPVLENRFNRLTFVNKRLNERCTIDVDLNYEYKGKEVTLNNLVIVEIKSDGKPSQSPLANALREKRIKSAGFSKYCVGRTLTDKELKQNSFKKKLRQIHKTIN